MVRENRKIARAASIVGGATLLSRIGGLVRDQVTAYFFGSSMAAAAFVVAFRIPNLFRRLLGEGALTVAFVPVFSQTLQNGGAEATKVFFRKIFTLMLLVLLAVSILGVFFAPELVTIMAPGFRQDPAKYQLTVYLTRILFPYIFFMGLGALFMGALNAKGHFITPALGPFVGNVTITLGAIFLTSHFDQPILGLAAGAMLGGFLQLAIQLPALRSFSLSLRPDFHFFTPEVKKVLLLMGPAALGAASYQISVFINTILASFLPAGSIPWLYFADRLMQFPLGIFTVAIGVAALPALSRQVASGDHEGFLASFRFALGLSFFITVPAMVGLIALAQPLVAFLFERGDFNAHDSLMTAQALQGYALGLPFLSGAGILARVFYSRSNTKTPMIASSTSLAIGALAAFIMMWPWQHVGLALASALASIINFFWLYIIILKHEKGFPQKEMAKEIVSYFLLAALMGLAVWPLSQWALAATSFGELMAKTLLAVTGGALLYLGLSILTKRPHLSLVWELISRKISKRPKSH